MLSHITNNLGLSGSKMFVCKIQDGGPLRLEKNVQRPNTRAIPVDWYKILTHRTFHRTIPLRYRPAKTKVCQKCYQWISLSVRMWRWMIISIGLKPSSCEQHKIIQRLYRWMNVCCLDGLVKRCKSSLAPQNIEINLNGAARSVNLFLITWEKSAIF